MAPAKGTRGKAVKRPGAKAGPLRPGMTTRKQTVVDVTMATDVPDTGAGGAPADPAKTRRSPYHV